jgi:hypothetical protein
LQTNTLLVFPQLLLLIQTCRKVSSYFIIKEIQLIKIVLQTGNSEYAEFLHLREYSLQPFQIVFQNKTTTFHTQHWRQQGIFLILYLKLAHSLLKFNIGFTECLTKKCI